MTSLSARIRPNRAALPAHSKCVAIFEGPLIDCGAGAGVLTQLTRGSPAVLPAHADLVL